MSSEFTVYLPGLKKDAEEFPKMYQSIDRENEALQRIQNNLKGEAAYGGIADTLTAIIQNHAVIGRNIRVLEAVLAEAAKAYEETEGAIVNNKVKEHNQGGNSGSSDGSSAEEEEGSIWDYLGTAFWQALVGDFTDESNGLGIVLSVAIGFIPYVGQIADVRDLIADVYNLIDDGPTTSEWVDLGFTLVGFIPGIGDFVKHADDLGPIFKHLDDISDGLGDTAKDLFKHADEFYSAIEGTVAHYNDMFDEKVLAKITDKIDDVLEEMPKLDKAVDKIKDFLAKEINEEGTIGDFVSELAKEASGIEDGVKEWISDTIDGIFGNDSFEEVGDAAMSSAGFIGMAAA